VIEPLRIHAPDADAALALVERLSAYRATTEPGPDGTWSVSVPLRAAPRATVPAALATTRDWLDENGIAAVSVDLDGHTHLIRSDGSPSPAR
jgi:hypothetical protein